MPSHMWIKWRDTNPASSTLFSIYLKTFYCYSFWNILAFILMAHLKRRTWDFVYRNTRQRSLSTYNPNRQYECQVKKTWKYLAGFGMCVADVKNKTSIHQSNANLEMWTSLFGWTIFLLDVRIRRMLIRGLHGNENSMFDSGPLFI